MEPFALQSAFERAQQFEKEGNLKEAVQAYKTLLNEYTSFRPAYLNLGYILFQNGIYRDALACYERALVLEEDHLTYFNMGSIYYRMGDYKKAVINLEKCRKLNSEFPIAVLVMGLCYSRMNNFRAAERNFNEILVVWPSNRVALTALAIMYYNQGRHDESISFLNTLLSLDEDNHRIRELKSAILLKTGDIDASAEEKKRVARESEEYQFFNEYIRTVPVEVLTDRYGSIDEKIDDLREKNDPHSLISLSLCHLFKGDSDAAIDLLYRAKKENH